MKHLLQASFLSLVLVTCTIGTAQAAYIDPNAGGLLFQLLAVIFTVASGFILFFSSRIRMLSARLRRKRRSEDDGDNTKGLNEDDTL